MENTTPRVSGVEPIPEQPGKWRVRMNGALLCSPSGRVRTFKSEQAARKVYGQAIERASYGRAKGTGPSAQPEMYGLGYMQGRGAS
jgi:hypothetical protein